MRHFILISVEHDDPAVAEQTMAHLRRHIHDGALAFNTGSVGDLVLREDRDFDYTGFSQVEERRQVAAVYDRMRDRARVPVVDRRPHSRACGMFCRGHGPACSPDCPTCHGRPE